jgi:hypothetical protein
MHLNFYRCNNLIYIYFYDKNDLEYNVRKSNVHETNANLDIWMDDESRIKAQINAFDKIEVANTPLLKVCIEQAKFLSSRTFQALDCKNANWSKLLHRTSF